MDRIEDALVSSTAVAMGIPGGGGGGGAKTNTEEEGENTTGGGPRGGAGGRTGEGGPEVPTESMGTSGPSPDPCVGSGTCPSPCRSPCTRPSDPTRTRGGGVPSIVLLATVDIAAAVGVVVGATVGVGVGAGASVVAVVGACACACVGVVVVVRRLTGCETSLGVGRRPGGVGERVPEKRGVQGEKESSGGGG